MVLVEKFTEIVFLDEEEDIETGTLAANIAIIIAIRILLIYIVFLLWPKVMPKIFKGAEANPKFIQLLGFSVIIALI